MKAERASRASQPVPERFSLALRLAARLRLKGPSVWAGGGAREK